MTQVDSDDELYGKSGSPGRLDKQAALSKKLAEAGC